MGRLLAALLVVSLGSEGLGSHASQDRAELPAKIDTWYRVVQGKRTVGFAHEVLKHGASPWRYEYAYDREFTVTIRKRNHDEDLSVVALLDETLTPVEYSAESHANEAPATLSFYTVRDERRFESRPASSKEATAWTAETKDDLHVLPTLTLYSLRQSEAMAKPGRLTVRVVDPRGEERDGVEAVIEVGETARREILGKEIPATPVKFLKPFPAAARETELRDALVDRCGRILEATFAGGAKIVMARDKDEALAEIGPVHRTGRRDPFDKLTAMMNASRERLKAQRGESEVPDPPVTVDSLMSDLAAVRAMIAELRGLKSAGDVEEGRPLFLKALVHLKVIREVASKRRPEMGPDITQVWEDVHAAWEGAARVEQEARELFVRIEGQVERLEVEAVEGTLKELKAYRDRIEVERRPERERIGGWAAEVGGLVVKVRTRRELANARIAVSGITVGERVSREPLPGVAGEEVTFTRRVAMADINGAVYRIGDTLAGSSIRVERISKHSVQVSLREEVREVPLRR